MKRCRQMVRHRSADFVPRLLEAAARVFARQGLKGSRMADIAREMGVAHGSVYNYVESKEALFLLLVDQWGRDDLDLRDRDLPLKTPPMDSIVSRLRQRAAETFTLPALDGALRRRRPANPQAELRAVVQELFDQTERSREGATILERSARDVPELFGLFFEQVRRDLFERMTRYVTIRIQDGALHGTDPQTAARFIIESVTFFARHRFLDPHPQTLDDGAVRQTIVDLVTRSLTPGGGTTSHSNRPAKRSVRRRS
jgi:AcrR family transcriptional regulator